MRANRTRKNVIQIYLSDEEINKLKKDMKEYNYENKSEYIRSLILNSVYINSSVSAIHQEQINLIVDKLKAILKLIRLKQKTSIRPEELKQISDNLKELDYRTSKVLKNNKISKLI